MAASTRPQTHLLYGRQISRWWDLVGGVRQDFRPGAAADVGCLRRAGLAPYWFEIEATAYVGASVGRTRASRLSTSCSSRTG